MASVYDKDLDLKYIKELYKSVSDLEHEVNKKSQEEKERYITELAKKEEQALQSLVEKLARIKAEGITLSVELEAQFKREAEEALYREKLELELSILETISGKKALELQKQHDKDVVNEKRLDAIKAKLASDAAAKKAKNNPTALNKSDAKAAKDLEKKANKELKEASRTEAFHDMLSSLFSDLLKYKDKDQAAAAAAQVHAENLSKTMKGVGKAITDGLNKINSTILSYGDTQLKVNTRLLGATTKYKGKVTDLTFSTLIDNLSDIAYSPLVSAETLYKNLESLVESGVASNLEQRTVLMTLSEGIAATFEANDEFMRKMIRLQQADSTAARLGMEYYLTAWLNEYVQNTEYLTSTFDTVANSLMQASALLLKNTGVTGVSEEFEFIVLKWLGALTGVGLSESTASSIAEALGLLGSGDVEFFGSNIGKLLTLSAANAGLDIGQLISEGLSATDTNALLKSLTEYLQEVADESSNVVKNQLGKTFGVTISDLIAVTNLADINAVYDNVLSYTDMYTKLAESLGGLAEREGIAKIMSNALANYTYQTGMDIASKPVLYATWAITDLIQGVTGGINIPAISAFGTGIDLETSVENLIKLGIVGVSTIGNIGSIVRGLSTTGLGSTKETKLLDLYQIYAGNETILTRGNGLDKSAGTRISSTVTSISNYVGNEDGDSMAESAITEAEGKQDKKKKNTKVNEKEDDPVALYLKDADFIDGFKTIVKKVGNIANYTEDIKKKVNGTINVKASVSGISGFFTASDGSSGTWSM